MSSVTRVPGKTLRSSVRTELSPNHGATSPVPNASIHLLIIIVVVQLLV